MSRISCYPGHLGAAHSWRLCCRGAAVLIATGLMVIVSPTAGAVDQSASTNMDETITGSEILSRSASIACLAWQPVGACLWMTCTPFGCEFDWSIKVRHFTPDATVTSYHVTGQSPWTETQGYAQPSSLAQDGGNNTEGATTRNVTALRFKNADVIGSPGVLWIQALSQSGYLCDVTTTPYRPYFLSTLDPNWRSPLIETPWTLRHWLRSVRAPDRSTWGPIYPRIGFVQQGHDYKAGAVVAQRAADIVSRDSQPHGYWPMNEDDPDQGQWPPGPVTEGDAATHHWQQLIPFAQADGCRIFADEAEQHAGPIDPLSERLSENTGYAFNLWRPYRCCEQEGAVLIFHTGE